MSTIGARLVRVAPGEVDIELDVRSELTQQHGFLHAGVLEQEHGLGQVQPTDLGRLLVGPALEVSPGEQADTGARLGAPRSA